MTLVTVSGTGPDGRQWSQPVRVAGPLVVPDAGQADDVTVHVDGRVIASGTSEDGRQWSRQITQRARLRDLLWVARLQDEAEQLRIGMDPLIEAITDGVRYDGSQITRATPATPPWGSTELRQAVDADIRTAHERHLAASVTAGVAIGTAEGDTDPDELDAGSRRCRPGSRYVAALRSIAARLRHHSRDSGRGPGGHNHVHDA